MDMTQHPNEPTTRVEHDLLGSLEVPADALYGIHTERARRNFRIANRPVHPALIHAYGAVKCACARTNRSLVNWESRKADAIEAACLEMQSGALDRHIVVDALQGGAGTSTNMNVNEVLANRALALLGHRPGDYAVLHPIEDINRHQSTNDTYPTALKVAAITQLGILERALAALVQAFQEREQALASIVKVGRTELQDAVLTTLGRSMGAFAEAFARDRWRTHKAVERLRVVNLGGTAIGTGIGAPRRYIFGVVEQLRAVTGLNLARAENLIDATQNLDAVVEVSGMLSACAANLMKIAGDLRLMASGPDAGLGEIRLQPRQAGSSIMPGKVNPVVPEAAVQAAIAVNANHTAIAHAAGMGNLELNAFMPLVADALLTNVDLLTGACDALANCASSLEACPERCESHVDGSAAVLTALLDTLGYDEASRIGRHAQDSGLGIRDIVLNQSILDQSSFDALISPERVTRLGSPESDRHETHT